MSTDQTRPDSTGGYESTLGYTVSPPTEPASAEVGATTTDRPKRRARTWLAGAALVGIGLAAGSGITAAVTVNGASTGGSGVSAGQDGGPGGGPGGGGQGDGQRGAPPEAGSQQQGGSQSEQGDGAASTAPSTESSTSGG